MSRPNLIAVLAVAAAFAGANAALAGGKGKSLAARSHNYN